MTPTEQDKMSDIDKLERRLAEWTYRVSIGDLMPDTLVRGAMQLITADRKRVALEAKKNGFYMAAGLFGAGISRVEELWDKCKQEL